MKGIRKLFTLSKRMQRWLAILPVALAVGVVVLLVRSRSGPVVKPVAEIAVSLRVIETPVVDLVPRVYGHGLAEPSRVWRAVAQVPGRIVFVSPRFSAGMLFDEGALLVKIDPTDYELAVARLEAAMAETRARIDELAVEKEHHAASLRIEKASLALAEASLQRKQGARDKGVVTPDEVDREARDVLRQQQNIQALENALGLIPFRLKTLEATLAAHAANIEQANLDLARTHIKAPFDCRLAQTQIEQGQFVNKGQTMFEAHGTGGVEIEAKMRPEQMRTLLPDDKRHTVAPGFSMESLRDVFDINVTIRVRSGEWEASWPARFDRIRELVDPRTRAINVVAVVDDPYGKVVPGKRPALVRGMYCEMELRAPPHRDVIVLPRSAVHGRRVYIVDSDSRMRERDVKVAFTQGELAVIASGLTAGEMVVVSDPTPALEGMRVDATPDPLLRSRLIDEARGHGGEP